MPTHLQDTPFQFGSIYSLHLTVCGSRMPLALIHPHGPAIIIITRTSSSYEQGPSPPARLGPCAPQSPPKLAQKDAGLGAKVKTQANVWAVVFAVMGSALEVQKAECVPIWIYLISHAHIDQLWPPSRYGLRIGRTSYWPNLVKICLAVQEI